MKSLRNAVRAGLVASLFLLLATQVGAVPPPPAVFYGTAFVNGANIPDGTPVSAWGTETMYAQQPSLTYQGMSYYTLTVVGDDPDTPEKEGAVPGETIRFRIGDLWADQTAVWSESGGGVLDLTASRNTVLIPLYLPGVMKNKPRFQVTSTPVPTATPSVSPTPTPTQGAPGETPIPTQMTIVGAQDTYIFVDDEGTNYGNSGELHIKTSQQSKRPLLRFDVSRIPSNAIVESAMLKLWTTAYPYTQPQWSMEVRCYPLKRAWNEMEATWQLAADGQPWGAPGADDTVIDREAMHVANTTVRAPSSEYVLNVTSAVRRWVTDPSANHGLILIGDGNISEYRFHASWLHTPEGKKPALEISLRMP